METVIAFLDSLKIGEGRSHGKLTVFPVHGVGGSSLEYLVLSEAIASGELEIREKDSATVPELLVINHGKHRVLIMDGEEITGGKQNRLVNISLLIEAHSEAVLPVSCVEQGRWHQTSATFAPGEATFGTLRRDKTASVNESLRLHRLAAADQGEIWNEIHRRSTAARVESPTHAMHDIYESRSEDLRSYEAAFPYVAGAIGIVAATTGGFYCADVFDKPATASAFWSKLIRSYAMDAIDSPSGAPATRESSQALLEAAKAARLESFKSPGIGHDVRLEGNGVVGSALVVESQVVHLAIFKADRQASRGHGLRRASDRWRAHRDRSR